ncbi:MAG TPA: hypothetical protein VLC92_09280 [Rhodocyclaceae bacterium]|nr:hypothetical protein [Rhodocyclaceae bacterium]
MLSSTVPLESLERRYVADASLGVTRSAASAVSWGAIAAGAAAGAALSLILLILGVGLGLSTISPWSYEGISAASLGVSTILWLTLTQLLASAMGGYLAGRLRTRWVDTHTDEIYFRDTAHGFLAWAVASLATAVVLTSVIGSVLGGGIRAGASVVGGAATTASVAASGAAASGKLTSNDNEPWAYFVDALFRPGVATVSSASSGAATPADAPERTSTRDTAEVGRIFMNASRSSPLPAEDLRYVAQLVAQRTGLSQQEAEKRVADTYARAQAKLNAAEAAAKDAADKARKASAYAALWGFISLLAGAFIASLSATYGGRRRDA